MAFFIYYAQCLLLLQMGLGTEAVTCNFPDGPKDCMFHCSEKDCSFHPKLLWVVLWVVLFLVGLLIGICCCCCCCCRREECRQRRRQLNTRITDCCCSRMRNRAPSSSDFSHLHSPHVQDNENHI